MIRVALVGVGPHAQRVYLPALQRLTQLQTATLSFVVELEEAATETAKHLSRFGFLDNLLVAVQRNSGPRDYLPEQLAKELTRTAHETGTTAVIIATEPVAHLAYLRWAASAGLHTLTDKPIITFDNIANDAALAASISTAFNDLLRDYERADTYIAVNAQRRFHPGFQRVEDAVLEAASRFSCPITSIQSLHCDGQWRMPPEIRNQRYHPYNTGYGKLSHSGYHILDIQAHLLQRAALAADTQYSSARTYAQRVRPDGLLAQVRKATYQKIFGSAWNTYTPDSDELLKEKFRSYGEVDVTINSSFRIGSTKALLSQATLLHNGISRRDSMYPGTDLYKGNGHARHEYHNIEQGPFQCIQVHSYRINDQHSHHADQDFAWGGYNHFDIYIYRNASLWGHDEPMQKITASDLAKKASIPSGHQLTESVRFAVVDEFLMAVGTPSARHLTRSHLASHQLTNALMSNAYQSLATDQVVDWTLN